MTELERIGLRPELIQHVEQTARRYVEQGKVAGLVTVLAGSEGEPYAKAHGRRSLETDEPMQVDTLMRIASLTKPITAAATLLLVEDGRLSLDEPVAEHIPEFRDLKVLVDDETPRRTVPLKRPITLRHLLTHTSGLAYGLLGDTPVESMYRRAEVLGSPLEELVEKLATLPLAAQPGETWRYSISYDILGYIIERVAGTTFDEFLRSRLFRPLEMRDTGFAVPEILSHRLAGYYTAPGDDGLQPMEPGAGSYLHRAGKGAGRPIHSGGGGLIATAPDYVRFMRMMLNGGELGGTHLLRSRTVRRMTTNQLDEDQLPIRLGRRVLDGMGYGFGFGVKVTDATSAGQPSKGTYWWAGITGTLAWADPELGLIGIVMTQAARYYEPAFAFQNSVYRALRGSRA